MAVNRKLPPYRWAIFKNGKTSKRCHFIELKFEEIERNSRIARFCNASKPILPDALYWSVNYTAREEAQSKDFIN